MLWTIVEMPPKRLGRGGVRKSAIRNSAPDPGHRSRSPRGAACRKGGARQRAISSASTAEAKPPGKDLEGVELRNYLARLFLQNKFSAPDVAELIRRTCAAGAEGLTSANEAATLAGSQKSLSRKLLQEFVKIRTCRISTTRKFPCRMTKVMK